MTPAKKRVRRRRSTASYMSKVAEPMGMDAHDGTERPVEDDAFPAARAAWLCCAGADLRVEHELPTDVMLVVESEDPRDLLDSPSFGTGSDAPAQLMPFGRSTLPWLSRRDQIREWRADHARRLDQLERDALPERNVTRGWLR
jgi:hypothetical protein